MRIKAEGADLRYSLDVGAAKEDDMSMSRKTGPNNAEEPPV
jgi:hypothetical protein